MAEDSGLELRELPMFPLGSVLLPSAVLPLHLFEPRYLQLARDVLDGDREFGVVLIERGHEVGGGDVRSNIGTIAQVVDATQFDDGRYAIAAVGTHRFEVAAWLADDPYPKAQVTMLAEVRGAGVEALYSEARSSLDRWLDLATDLGRLQVGQRPELTDDPMLGSFQIAAVAPLGPFDRQRVVAAVSAEDRLRLLLPMLEDGWHDLQAEGEQG